MIAKARNLARASRSKYGGPATASVLSPKLSQPIPSDTTDLHHQPNEGRSADRMEADQVGRAVKAPDPAAAARIQQGLNAAFGCKTDQFASTLLAQVISVENPGRPNPTHDEMVRRTLHATAMLAELHPANATEGMLAAQMIGTQRVAMKYLERAILPGPTTEETDANVQRATRLMRLFNEQVDTMSKLKGTSGQQRVVVEHVTVEAGGRAIVGALLPGGRVGGGTDSGR